MYLTQLLHRNRQGRPGQIALVDGPLRRGYAELEDRVARLAAGLQAQGVRGGDRVAMLSLNSVPLIESLFACWWIGAVACPINIRWSGAEIAASLQDCTPCLLLHDATHAAAAADVLERLREAGTPVPPLGRLGDGEGLATETIIRTHDRVPDGRHGGDTLAVLLYTGGTTGRSKGVMLTHANLYSAAAARICDLGQLGDSVAMLSTPLFHIAAITRALPHLTAGGTVVLVGQFRADTVLDLIEAEGVTDLPLVPSMLQMLIEHPAFRPERLRSVQRMSYGAAPSARALLERAQALVPWAGLYQYYGMTESCALGSLSVPTDHDAAGWASGRALSAGRACTAIELRVVDELGRDLTPGEIGEIISRGPSVMPGYWQRPEETAQALRDGWLHTGDAGRLDENGYLTVVDRIKDMIVTGGENVYSAEVENVLSTHAAVRQCAVIGLPDPLWGEAVHAVIVPWEPGAFDEAALRAHCRAALANYKCPKSYSVVAELPLTAAGKVAKNVLRKQQHAGAPGV